MSENDLEQVLFMARRALLILETQAAGYTELTIPVHLRIELDKKREEVERLEGYSALARPLNESRVPLNNLVQRQYDQFVGREKELQKLQRLLSVEGRSFLLGIHGVGGIGKTSLALENAWRYLEGNVENPEVEHFDAIIWTSAKTETLKANGIEPSKPMVSTLDQIYDTICVVLKREDIRHASRDVQSEMIRQALRSCRALLIVDDFESLGPEPVLSFLVQLPSPTKVVVTAREILDTVHPIPLEGLPFEKAQELIQQQCEIQDRSITLTSKQVRKLFELTGGIPLAIVYSIGRVAWGCDPKSVLTSLTNREGPLVKFCFEKSLRLIENTPSETILRALTVFTKDAGREALAYVTQLDDERLDDGILKLTRLSLINRHGKRFDLLPFTKQLAQDFVDRKSYFSRLADWYKDFLKVHGGYRKVRKVRLQHLEGANTEFGFSKIDSEIENILGIMELLPRSPADYDLRLVYYARRLSDYLYFTDRWAKRIEWCSLSYDMLLQQQPLTDKERYLAGWLARDVGWTYYQYGDWQRAAEWASHAWSMIEPMTLGGMPEDRDSGKDEDGGMEFSWLYTVVHGLRAHVAMRQGSYDLAESLFRKSLEVQKRLYDKASDEREQIRKAEQVAIYYSDLANLRLEKKDYEGAAVYFRNVLDEPWSANLGRVIEAQLSLAELAWKDPQTTREDLENAYHTVREAHQKLVHEMEIEQNKIRKRNIDHCKLLLQRFQARLGVASDEM